VVRESVVEPLRDGYPAAVEMTPGDGMVTRKAVGTRVGGLANDAASVTVRSTGGGAELWIMGLAQDAAKIAATDVLRLLAGKPATTLSDLPASVAGEDGTAVAMTAVRGTDTASDLAALAAGAAVVRGGGGCALVALDAAAASPRARVLKSWPLASGGACSAAVSAAFVATDARGSAAAAAAAHVAVVTVDAATAAATHAVLPITLTAEGAGGSLDHDHAYSYTSAPVAGYAPTDHGAPVAAWAHSYPVKKGGKETMKYAVLLLSADAQLSLHGEAGKEHWAREEALALAAEIIFARLPPPKSAAAAAADDLRVRPSFEERYRVQLLALKARFNQARKRGGHNIVTLQPRARIHSRSLKLKH
jgi:hypothetical protein